MPLKYGLGVTQGHRKLYHSKACVLFPIRIPQCSSRQRDVVLLVENRDFYHAMLYIARTMLSQDVCLSVRHTPRRLVTVALKRAA